MEKKAGLYLIFSNQDLSAQTIPKWLTTNYILPNSMLFFVNDNFFLQPFLARCINRKSVLKKKTYHILNFIPFQRFKVIYRINHLIKRLLILFIIKFFRQVGRDVALFIKTDMFSFLVGVEADVYLLCPALGPLVLSNQVELVEGVRKIAINSKVVFVKNSQDAKEMKIFNKSVVKI